MSILLLFQSSSGTAYTADLAETVTLSESLATSAAATVSVSETVTVSESLATTASMTASLTETITVAESLSVPGPAVPAPTPTPSTGGGGAYGYVPPAFRPRPVVVIEESASAHDGERAEVRSVVHILVERSAVARDGERAIAAAPQHLVIRKAKPITAAPTAPTKRLTRPAKRNYAHVTALDLIYDELTRRAKGKRK